MKKKRVKSKQVDWTSGAKQKGAASRAGQLIGGTFEILMFEFVTEYLSEKHPDFEIMDADRGKALVKLDMFGGSSKQLDTVIGLKSSSDPVALLESKWLKDGRHHNDKGAWILQLREVKKLYPTVRGAVALLAGFWTEGLMLMLASEGGIDTVLVARDDEVYHTLQPYLDAYLGDDTFKLDPAIMRDSYPNPGALANCLEYLNSQNTLQNIARNWLNFERDRTENGQILTGKEKIQIAIDNLLQPIPENVHIEQFEISLQISSGNIIHQKFSDIESAIEFIKRYYNNSDEILGSITPESKTDSTD